MGLSHSSPSPLNALAFHHEAHGGARIISVTAVTAPCVRSFTTLYTLLKKKVVPSKNSCCWLALLFLRLLLLGRGSALLHPQGTGLGRPRVLGGVGAEGGCSNRPSRQHHAVLTTTSVRALV